MTKPTRTIDRVLYYEAAGFALIIAVTWANELLDLTRVLFGGNASMDWHEAALESTLVLGVGAVTMVSTWRLLQRVHYLEGFVRMCAWCRRIAHNEEWVQLESFLTRQLNTQTSHGICTECAHSQAGDFELHGLETPQPRVVNRSAGVSRRTSA